MIKTTAPHVHHAFWYISLTSTARLRRETSYFDVLWRTWTYDDEFSFVFFNLNIILKNLTPEKSLAVDIYWAGPNRQIKFERTQIFLPTFSEPSSSSLLKVPNLKFRRATCVYFPCKKSTGKKISIVCFTVGGK